MSVHTRKNGYVVVAYYDSAGRPRTKGFGRGPAAKKAADIFDLEWRLQKAKGLEPRDSSTMYPDELCQHYLNHLKAEGKSLAFRTQLRDALKKRILPLINHRPVDKLRYAHMLPVVEMFERRKVSRSTINHHLRYLKTIFKFGIDHELTSGNPLARWKCPKDPKRRVQLNVEDLGKIMDSAAPHVARAIEVQYNLGTRPGWTELFSLRFDENVDYDKGGVWVGSTKTMKGAGKDWRFVPCPTDFMVALKEWEQESQNGWLIEYHGRPVKQISRALHRAAERANIKYRVTMYDIRHLFASLMLAKGADLAAVSRLLGHADISTTQKHYYELMQGEMERAVSVRPSLGRRKKAGKVVKMRR